MVGEIRDLETAQIAVQASLTGHLVLSTLHTNSAVGAITRMDDMGIEPFLLSSSLVAVLSQRLVRVLCPACKRAEPAAENEHALLGDDHPAAPIYHAVGCPACNGQGYRGRMGIYELILIDEDVRRLIRSRSAESDLLELVRADSPSLRDDGFRCVREGLTTLQEVLRVTQEN
jgi:general secretion pathway protein E